MAADLPHDLDGIRACIDRLVPPKNHAERMAFVKDSVWQAGDLIQITFLDGDPEVCQRVVDVANTWLDYADLVFSFVADPNADIRISFNGRGSWSFIGTTCRQIAAPEPTMNYGWLTPSSPDDELRRVVLHEFGHAIGCIHEHQNPAGGIQWNKEAVYKYYEGEPNNWSREQVDQNLFATYDQALLLNTPVDGSSIMMYPIDASFTLDGYSVGLNTDLSATDREFVAQIYE